MNAQADISPTRLMLDASTDAMLVDDVTQIVQRTPFIVRTPARFFSVGLTSELAEAIDLLSVKLADVKEAHGAGR